MREDKAVKLFCPICTSKADKGIRCVGSNCMMWITFDNESEPSPEGIDRPKCFPAGDCGLKTKESQL